MLDAISGFSWTRRGAPGGFRYSLLGLRIQTEPSGVIPIASQASSGSPSAGPKVETRPLSSEHNARPQPNQSCEPDSRDAAHGHACEFGSQGIRASVIGTVALLRHFVQAVGSGDNYVTVRVFRDALGARQHAAKPGDGVEALPVEAENLRTGVGPERAIGGHVQSMDLRGTRQPFRNGHETKPGPVIAVESTFRSRPHESGSVLRQRKDGQILKPIGGAVMAKAVLLRRGSASKRQEKCSTRAEITTPAHHGFLIPSYGPSSDKQVEFHSTGRK